MDPETTSTPDPKPEDRIAGYLNAAGFDLPAGAVIQGIDLALEPSPNAAWGQTWTKEDINAAYFGAAVRIPDAVPDGVVTWEHGTWAPPDSFLNRGRMVRRLWSGPPGAVPPDNVQVDPETQKAIQTAINSQFDVAFLRAAYPDPATALPPVSVSTNAPDLCPACGAYWSCGCPGRIPPKEARTVRWLADGMARRYGDDHWS